ncbi:MAG TPA: hypothetical protein VK593_00745, partial [Edaphobacter sp.]|nr:hypothetical protein [Edaphobacter sp.]
TAAAVSEAAAKDRSSQPPASDPLHARPGSAQAIPRGTSDPRHPLPNRDLDTGSVVRPSGYPLTDATYCQLAHRLAAKPTQAIPPVIKDDILAYYADLSLPFATKSHPSSWHTLQADLTTLRHMPTSNEPLPYPTYGPEGDTAESPAQ